MNRETGRSRDSKNHNKCFKLLTREIAGSIKRHGGQAHNKSMRTHLFPMKEG